MSSGWHNLGVENVNLRAVYGSSTTKQAASKNVDILAPPEGVRVVEHGF